MKQKLIKLTKRLAFFVVAVLGLYIAMGYLLSETITITPSKTERVGSEYLVFSDKGVYADKDDWRFLKFNSSDIYGNLSNQIRKPVTVKVTGFRLPLLSIYKNIVEVKQ